MYKHPLVKEILITEKEINERIVDAAKWVDETYANSELILVGPLKGCIPFFGRLMTAISIDFKMDFIVVSSFKGKMKATGIPEIVTDIKLDIRDKDVLIVEDIVDSAYTLKYVKEYLQNKGAKSVKIITLLNKQSGRKVDLNPDYKLFEVEDKFLVGFGLDYNEKLRNLPYVGVFDTDKEK